MKSIIKSLMWFAAALSLAGCEKGQTPEVPDNTGDQTPLTYTLRSDKAEAEVNEPFTFTVVASNGEEVTSEWNICDESVCFTSNVMVYTEPGTHTISAHTKADPTVEAGNTLTVTVKAAESSQSLPVNPDALYELYADSDTADACFDFVTFKVREIVDGEVTNENYKNFKVGVVGSEMHDRFDTAEEYCFTEPGTYEIDAVLYYMVDGKSHQIKTDNTVGITVLDKRPAEGYTDNFYRRVLYFKWTATWCPGCPALDATLERVMEEYPLVDRIVPVSIHDGGSDYCYPGAEAAAIYTRTKRKYNVEYIPSCAVDCDVRYFAISPGDDVLAKYVKRSMRRTEAEAVPGIKIATSLDERTLSYTLTASIREAGEYMVGIYFIENGLTTLQVGSDTGRMTQNHVLHGTVSAGDNDLALHECGTLAAGEEFEYSGTYEIPVHAKPADFVFENCQLVYFICRTDEAVKPYGIYCANAGAVALGESTEYEYEPATIE